MRKSNSEILNKVKNIVNDKKANSPNNNLSNNKTNETIEVEFRLLLDSWLKRNLNKLIELEISNYIKNRQN